ncbi:hypothetical protein ACJ73_02033 [Blastomyces percursus]|uniref:Uncharacterized protein n=1 Tax=Blastomyces percursus TaxID=1658174 RepID=A0A1J9QDG8_9EURO|nr:hypothetical protein ACJ73_02033 [Blastomyces percursus]
MAAFNVAVEAESSDKKGIVKSSAREYDQPQGYAFRTGVTPPRQSTSIILRNKCGYAWTVVVRRP